MPSRRQEKVARVIRESVSEIIAQLNDPRICGIVSVTDVSVSADLKNADVSLSIMAADQVAEKRVFSVIERAGRYIQAQLGRSITARFCPRLKFHEDKKLKGSMEIIRLIDEASRELEKRRQEREETPPGSERQEQQ